MTTTHDFDEADKSASPAGSGAHASERAEQLKQIEKSERYEQLKQVEQPESSDQAATTERILRIASQTLKHMRFGLTLQGCKAVCELLLPETAAIAVAMTNRVSILGYAGKMAAAFPIGSPIRTQPTRDVLETGVSTTFGGATLEGTQQSAAKIPAGIVVPLLIRDGTAPVGTIKFYYNSLDDINQTQHAIVRGFGELLSTQLASHALERQETLTAEAELRALQAQINPHFLFNTLNTIASLTRTNPSEARELLREFAAFYRQTLEGSQTLIPLSRELEQTRRYLRFEHARFGKDRIIEREQMSEGCEDVLVPAFIVQPIVENAVRHAMRDEGQLHIDIHVIFEGRDVLISITDDGLGMSSEVSSRILSHQEGPHATGGTGIALRNVSERLERLYGPESGIEIVSREGEGTSVTLRLVGAQDNVSNPTEKRVD